MLYDDLVAALRHPQTVQPWRLGIIAVEQVAQPADHDTRIAVDRGIEIGTAAQRFGRDGIGLGRGAIALQPMVGQILQQPGQHRRT
ncbi:hypothetical protein [Sphingopyxis sp. PET50]|uniref:hypothetical protein n=1 Tax=Sphingopyxis sp. PET50 TaxID=2976533 RepID=UPI0021AE8FC3|nr:hypothetical protein [Sphingopyxis sp. PET50]